VEVEVHHEPLKRSINSKKPWTDSKNPSKTLKMRIKSTEILQKKQQKQQGNIMKNLEMK
jgi:hypothetical protein